MNQNRRFLYLVTGWITFFCMVSVLVLAASEQINVMYQNIYPQESSVISNPFPWIMDNWEWLALVLSEALALIPSKWNGITQSVIKLFSHFYKKE